MASPLVRLPLSEGARAAAALRTLNTEARPNSLEDKATLSTFASTVSGPKMDQQQGAGGWSPSCE